MKSYENYKDSGVQWIGEIPSHWDVKPLKRLVSENQSSLGSDTPDDYELDYVEISDLDSSGRISNTTHYLFSDSPSRCRRVLSKGDVFISSVRTYLRAIGIVEDDVENLICSTGFSVLTPKEFVISKYLFYSLRTEWFISDVVSQSEGVSYPSIQSEKLLSIHIVQPPLTEQHQIVSFLDEKTSLIDDLIKKKEQKIGLLKEHRTSLINRVITKGLNPDCPMKDSGVEWIGEIPSHWDTPLGSRLGTYSKGSGIKKDEVVDSGLPCIRYGQIYTIYDHSVSQVQSFISNETSETSVPVDYGTLLLTGSGETKEDIGKCIVYTGDTSVWVGGDIIILHPDETYNPLYLTYLMNGECIRIQKEQLSKGEIVVHIYSKNFSQMRFVLPPLPEQEQIVSFLDEKTSGIDRTIQSEQKKIELLKEYRQSLISSMITGKIKVVN